MSTNSLVPMIGADGSPADVPVDKVESAMSLGAKRAVHMVSPEGSAAYVPIESFAAARAKGAKPIWEVQGQPPPSPSGASGAMSGLISPGNIAQAMTGTEHGFTDARDMPPGLNESPTHAALRAGIAGAGQSAADTLSSFTSPVSLATMGLGAATKAPGAIGTASRAILTASGLGFGAQGAIQAASNAPSIDELKNITAGAGNPDKWQKFILGGSQALGAAPALGQVGVSAKAVLAKAAPGAFAVGEPAIVAALKPQPKDVPMLRKAVRDVQPELQSSEAKTIPDLNAEAVKQRVQIGKQLEAEINRVTPNGGTIDSAVVANAIRSQITPLMKLRSTTNPQGARVPSPQEQSIMDYADAIESNLAKNPLSISQAEEIVQGINAEYGKFSRTSADYQRAAQQSGDPAIADLAMKQELQNQITQRLSAYPGLNKKYGAWKEIQNQSQKRIDAIDRQGPVADYTARRALEALGEAGAMMYGMVGSSPNAHAVGGIGLAYLLGRAGTDLYVEHLRSPERMIQRGITGLGATPPAPPNFSGAAVQPIANQQQQ